eukprot:5064198-Pleurochrysis_carterae.AAC.1
MSRSRYLLTTAEPFPHLQPMVAVTSVARQQQASYSRAHHYIVRICTKSPLHHKVAMRFGISTQHTNKPPKVHKCQCQSMQMGMHNNTSRNLQSPSNLRDQGRRRLRARRSSAFCL